MEHQTPRQDLELLVFELAGVRYALQLSAVREVVRAVLIAPLPDAPPVIEGIVDIRGELVPVYDLRLRFGLPPRALHPDERLVVAWTGSRLVSFRCERTEWVEHVALTRVEEGDVLPGSGRHIAGVARLDDGLVLIQQLEAFLDAAEAESLDEALSARAERNTE
ncbi:MAG TPA: chemotaxis protein CheW [Longimicrobiales bacterium]|nr:chemotaxis protein CheW [Longimicrobiales bacterium]